MPSLKDDLDTTVANAYRVFGKYSLSGALIVCRCSVCVDEQAARDLLSISIRNMPVHILTEYTHSAHGWNEDIDLQFRYFLPRYFDVIANGDTPSNTGLATCLERLGEAQYRSRWPQTEADAVNAFFMALFRVRLSEDVDLDPTGMPTIGGDPVEEILCMAAHSRADLAPLLAAWDADPSRNATLHIANILGSADWYRRKRLRNSWWVGLNRDHVEAAMGQVMQWLRRPETRERLEAACLAERDENAAALLSHAEGLVAGMIRAI